jgi:hypothetical protein
MSPRVEQWLAEQEVARLEAMYALEPAPEAVDRPQPTRPEAHAVRVAKSRLTK